MAIIMNDTYTANAVKEALKKNGGYCPCKLIKSEDTKCMCKAFREQEFGECFCGLYTKTKD